MVLPNLSQMPTGPACELHMQSTETPIGVREGKQPMVDPEAAPELSLLQLPADVQTVIYTMLLAEDAREGDVEAICKKLEQACGASRAMCPIQAWTVGCVALGAPNTRFYDKDAFVLLCREILRFKRQALEHRSQLEEDARWAPYPTWDTIMVLYTLFLRELHTPTRTPPYFLYRLLKNLLGLVTPELAPQLYSLLNAQLAYQQGITPEAPVAPVAIAYTFYDTELAAAIEAVDVARAQRALDAGATVWPLGPTLQLGRRGGPRPLTLVLRQIYPIEDPVAVAPERKRALYALLKLVLQAMTHLVTPSPHTPYRIETTLKDSIGFHRLVHGNRWKALQILLDFFQARGIDVLTPDMIESQWGLGRGVEQLVDWTDPENTAGIRVRMRALLRQRVPGYEEAMLKSVLGQERLDLLKQLMVDEGFRASEAVWVEAAGMFYTGDDEDGEEVYETFAQKMQSWV